MIPAADGPVQAHDGCHGPVDFFCGFFFIRLDVTGGIPPDVDVIHHPAKHRMPSMSNSLLQRELHKLLGRRAHVLKSLSEGDHRKAHPFQVLDHLYGTPSVKGDFLDIEPFPQLLDELFNIPVVDDISFCGLDETLAVAQVSYITWSRFTLRGKVSSGSQK
jgi:hypothetical protein